MPERKLVSFSAITRACKSSSSPGAVEPSALVFPSLTDPRPLILILTPVSASIFLRVCPRGPELNLQTNQQANKVDIGKVSYGQVHFFLQLDGALVVDGRPKAGDGAQAFFYESYFLVLDHVPVALVAGVCAHAVGAVRWFWRHGAPLSGHVAAHAQFAPQLLHLDVDDVRVHLRLCQVGGQRRGQPRDRQLVVAGTPACPCRLAGRWLVVEPASLARVEDLH